MENTRLPTGVVSVFNQKVVILWMFGRVCNGLRWMQGKRQRTMVTIGTHDGTFHCDEVMACYLLMQVPGWEQAELVRSRDPQKLAQADVVVDVGGVYDHASKRYDHHQRGFDEQFSSNHRTKLSSAGLVYKHYGMEVLRKQVGDELDDRDLERLYLKVYENLIEGLDGIDNGITQYVDQEGRPAKCLYKVNSDLSSRVGFMNPSWNEDQSDETTMKQFVKAMELVRSEFEDNVNFLAKGWFPARQIVLEAFEQRLEAHPSGQIMVLKQFCPWKGHLFEIETESNAANPILYVLYSDNSGKWRIQAVPKDQGSFENRLALPESWRGIRDEQLSKLVGIEGCVFVHAAGFIGAHESYEGALRMAELALKPL